MSAYKNISNFLEKNVVYKRKNETTEHWFNKYKNELKNDIVFQEILNLNIPLSNIFPINITSLCNYHCPEKIRIRSDLFLRKSIIDQLRETNIIFSCIKINGKKTYIILSSNYFSSYNKSIKSSNSFITKNFGDLSKWSKEQGDYYINERKTKRNCIVTYILWHGNEDHIEHLHDYLFVLAKIPQYGYLNLSEKKNNSSINSEIKKLICEFYSQKCALTCNNNCLTQSSRNEDISKEIHHLVPREYFRKNNIHDTSIINDINNLMLLCYKCHDKLSSKNKNERKDFLNFCLNSLKANNKFNDFEHYLITKVYITIPILFKIYGVDYE